MNEEIKMSPAFEKFVAMMQEHERKRFDIEREYFDTLSRITEHTAIQTRVINNLMKMSIDDQLKVLKHIDALAEVCVTLNDKYDFEEDEGDE